MHKLSWIIACLAAAATVSSSAIPTAHSSDEDDTPLPLVIWHGLGDNYAADGIARVGELAEEVHPGILVYNIRLDDDASADRTASFYGNLTLQIAKVCADLASHPILSTAPAIDALGFSQGGQFLRGYVERCNRPPVRNLVTFGSQHNGISEFQKCADSDWLCRGAQLVLRGNAWSDYVQSRLVPAQYYRKPSDLEKYLEHSNFLADINNERAVKNETYRENLMKLENFVMYLFEDDTTVIPKETSWFAEVNGTEVTDLRHRTIYTEDWLGLRWLDGKGSLKFEKAKGDHMTLTDKMLREVFGKYLGPQSEDSKENMKHQLVEEL
jgi:palmitoyl-protein thioesterase